jgi:uncharacterized YccA/Bax inhibitor family protein
MALFRKFQSSNPMFSQRVMTRSVQASQDVTGSQSMTVAGAVNKSMLLGVLFLLFCFLAFLYPLSFFIPVGSIGGFVLVLIAVFRPAWSPVVAPVHAVVEGLFVGAISAAFAAAFEGIIFHAVTLTMAVFFIMLFVYRTGIIKVTQKFRSVVILSTLAIAVVYLLNFVLSWFGVQTPVGAGSGWISIALSLFVVAIASLNLLLDFDNFEQGERHGLPAYMEWFFAMGLLITLVWLYIEMLRLLAIFNRE